MATTTKTKITKIDPVAWNRAETDPCEIGTDGCCIDHTNHPDHANCETW